VQRDEDPSDLLAPFDLRPVPLKTAMRLQLRALELGLQTVAPFPAEGTVSES